MSRSRAADFLPTAFLLTAFLPALLFAQAGGSISAKRIDASVKPLEARLIEWRRDFHQNPELSNREVRTAQKVEEHLRSLGLEVKTGIAHTGVAAVLRGGKPGPTIALRADMDALPVTELADVPFKSTATGEYRGESVGVMHACGHDAHVAILMTVAQALAGMRKDLPGNILFIFQPAEEGAPEGEKGGAKLMLDEGLFDIARPEVVFGLHVSSTLHAGDIGFRWGPFMAASDRMRIVVTGKQTHGARPWAGADPIVASAQIISSLQTIVSRRVDITANPAIVTIGAIRGGVRHNIIPDSVELLGTVRTFDPDQRKQILEDIRRIVENVGEAQGTNATVTMGEDSNPVVFNNPELVNRSLPALRRVAGDTHVKQISLVTGSEDFAFYAAAVPSFFFYVGITPPGQNLETTPANHSPYFYIDENGLPLAVRALMSVAIEYMSGGVGAARP
jgi:amidohydrolase